MDYIAEAKQLVQNLDQRMGPSPYDIGWLARVKTPDGDPRWPDQIDWLLENQHPDGSWGGQIEYYHDRIICTLISAIALSENGHNAQSQKAIKLAEYYIWHHLHLLPRDPFELVGFELIVPTLLSEAAELGLDVPNHTCGYGEIQTAKLKLIPPEKLYSPNITSIHSLEFLGRSANKEHLKKAQSSNGSLGNSPATTAYFLLFYPDDELALAYLENMLRLFGYPLMLYPFRTFELTWTLNNLIFSGIPITQLATSQIWDKLENELTSSGIGLDPTFGIPDGDITSVCSRLVTMSGRAVDPFILASFEKEEHVFRTYDYERNVSVGTNIHALEAINTMSNYPNHERTRDEISSMLLNKREFNIYWVDKWHTSPYYATTHAIVALLKEESCLKACRHTIDWLICTQRRDGSWGFFEKGTVEETAYTLIALLHYHRKNPIDKDILHRGANYIYIHQNIISNYPALWIDKCLYIPHNVVRSAVLAAIILYEQTVSQSFV